MINTTLMEVSELKQPTHTAIESQQLSTTTMEMVHLDPTKEIQECMDSYGIHKGVASFDTIALIICILQINL